jgi:hypothetical protein
MVDNPGSGPLLNACFHAPLTAIEKKVRAATLQSMHHSSAYRRLILQAKNQGATTTTPGTALHARLRENSKEGTKLLKFIHEQLYNGKLAKRYGHARRTSVPYATARTHVHTLEENVKPTKNSQSAATMQHASSHTRRYTTPQREEAHYTAQTTYAL